MANSGTVGFKASSVTFANQFLQTQELGTAPSSDSGGTNPSQIGLGTLVSEITPDFSQGTITNSTVPSYMAIQQEGMFVLRGSGNNQQLYSRNGQFNLNANNQLVNSTGNLLLGWGVDSSFNINSNSLEPLSIPLGTATVAQATQNMVLQGSLTPSGAIANQATILQTGVLGDAKFSAPSTAPTVSSPVAGNIPAGIYQYFVTYVNGTTESRPSPASTQVNLTSDSQVSITTAADASGQWSDVRVYRENLSNPGVLYQIADIAGGASASQTVTDNTADVTADPTLKSTMGPPITSSTLLTNVLTKDSSGDYVNAFPNTGTLSFTGNRGGQDLTAKTFTVTAQSTVQRSSYVHAAGARHPNQSRPRLRQSHSPGLDHRRLPRRDGHRLQPTATGGKQWHRQCHRHQRHDADRRHPSANATGQPVQFQSGTRGRGNERLGQRNRLRFAGYAADGQPDGRLAERQPAAIPTYRWFADCGAQRSRPGGSRHRRRDGA